MTPARATGIAILVLAGTAWAGPAAKGTAPAANGVDHEMKTMDTNGDGRLSAEEHASGARRMFEAMDADHDGRVTAAEMDAAHERVAGRKAAAGELSAADKIKVIDANGDGILSAEEHAAGSRRMFDGMDTDKDGSLTRAELAAGHARMLRKPS
jgi:Ca2+-binding EF-hand superfamily protein